MPFIANNFNLISVKLTVAGGNQNKCKIWFGKNRPKFRMNRSRLPLFDSVMQAFMLANQRLFNLHISLSTLDVFYLVLPPTLSLPLFIFPSLSFSVSLSIGGCLSLQFLYLHLDLYTQFNLLCSTLILSFLQRNFIYILYTLLCFFVVSLPSLLPSC